MNVVVEVALAAGPPHVYCGFSDLDEPGVLFLLRMCMMTTQMMSSTITMIADSNAPMKTMCGGVVGGKSSFRTPVPLLPPGAPAFVTSPSAAAIAHALDRLSRSFVVDVPAADFSSLLVVTAPSGPKSVRSMKTLTWPSRLPLQGSATRHTIGLCGI